MAHPYGYHDSNGVQAILPRFNQPPIFITQDILQAAIDDAIYNVTHGAGFVIVDGELRLKNITTGLYNPIYSQGADGFQITRLENGV